MKVSIGSYPSRLVSSRFYTDYMNNKYDYELPEVNSRSENIREKIEDTIQVVYDVFNSKYFDERIQKINVKIDRWDTWSMDHTLAHITVPMLKQLKETKHGAPVVDDADTPEMYHNIDSDDELFFKKYDWVLNEMIWSFEQKLDDSEKDNLYGTWVHDDTGGHMEGTDYEGLKAYQARLTNGFRLFGKYFETLWD